MIYNRLKTIISRMFQINANDIHINSRLYEDLGINSLEMVDLFLEIEGEFDIDLFDEHVETIADLVDLISRGKELSDDEISL